MDSTTENTSGLAGDTTTHFGFQKVREEDKATKVREVFKSVAPSYDLMNDLMSGGMHRLWKRLSIREAHLRAIFDTVLAVGRHRTASIRHEQINTNQNSDRVSFEIFSFGTLYFHLCSFG